MENMIERLLQEQNRLEKILQKTSTQLEDAPRGSLEMSVGKGYVRYYHYNEEKKIRNYISVTNQEFICRLAQKSYDKKIYRMAKKRLSQIKRITKDYDEDEIEKIYLEEREEKRNLIQPVEPTWEQQIKHWFSEAYKGKEFQSDMPVIMTERGEQVRSKSEKILADYFHRKGIPYKYEHPLYLKHFGTVYPDFTFLSKRMKQEIYWEHAGRMDDPAYAQNAVRKIHAYEENGIYPGERLILTFEADKMILDMKIVEQMVEKYLV